jgi:hypothetical protein
MSSEKPDKKVAAAEKADKTPKKAPAAAAKKQPGRHLPVIMELPFTLVQLSVTVLGIGVAILSYLAGCSPLMIAARSGVTILVTGLIGWFLYFNIARGSLETIHALLDEQKEFEKSNPQHIRDYSA